MLIFRHSFIKNTADINLLFPLFVIIENKEIREKGNLPCRLWLDYRHPTAALILIALAIIWFA